MNEINTALIELFHFNSHKLSTSARTVRNKVLIPNDFDRNTWSVSSCGYSHKKDFSRLPSSNLNGYIFQKFWSRRSQSCRTTGEMAVHPVITPGPPVPVVCTLRTTCSGLINRTENVQHTSTTPIMTRMSLWSNVSSIRSSLPQCCKVLWPFAQLESTQGVVVLKKATNNWAECQLYWYLPKNDRLSVMSLLNRSSELCGDAVILISGSEKPKLLQNLITVNGQRSKWCDCLG